MVEDLGVAWLRSGARPLGPGGSLRGAIAAAMSRAAAIWAAFSPQAMEPRTSDNLGLCGWQKPRPLPPGAPHAKWSA